LLSFLSVVIIAAAMTYYFAEFTNRVHNANRIYYEWDNGIFSGETMPNDPALPKLKFTPIVEIAWMVVDRKKLWILLAIAIAVGASFAPRVISAQGSPRIAHGDDGSGNETLNKN